MLKLGKNLRVSCEVYYQSRYSGLVQQEMEDKVISPEKAEEAKLKARYPNLGAKPGGSDLLRKRLQKGVGVYKRFQPHPVKCLTPSLLTIVLFCSKSTLILVTTTWQRPKLRISSCHRPQRRRRRSPVGTSQHLRTCLIESLQLFKPANLLADGFIFSPFCYHSKKSPPHIFLLFTLLLIFHICMHLLRTSYK